MTPSLRNGLRTLRQLWSARTAQTQRRYRPAYEVLEDRVVLDGNPATSAAEFVAGLYRHLLGRNPQAQEATWWTDQLAGGASHVEVAQGFLTSPEYGTGLIRDSYQRLLGRDAEPEGLNWWLVYGAVHGYDQRLVEKMQTSDEYYLRHGGTVAGWIAGLYIDDLKRAPDDAGKTWWINLVNAGYAREAITTGVGESAEAREQFIGRAYERLLGRSPEDSGLQHWLAGLESSLTPTQFLSAVLGSSEFAGRVTTAPATFGDALGLPPNVLDDLLTPGPGTGTTEQPAPRPHGEITPINPGEPGMISRPGAVALLEEDEPEIYISSGGNIEGNEDDANVATFTVYLSFATSEGVDVDYVTQSGTFLGTAGADAVDDGDDDFTPTSGTVHFEPYETEKQFTVPINGDSRVENNEQFKVPLSNPVNAILPEGTFGRGFITDDDVLPTDYLPGSSSGGQCSASDFGGGMGGGGGVPAGGGGSPAQYVLNSAPPGGAAGGITGSGMYVLNSGGAGAGGGDDCSCSCTCCDDGTSGFMADAFGSALGFPESRVLFSAGPVRYADGTLKFRTTDLASEAMGTDWGHTRSYSNGPGYSSIRDVGHGNVVTQWPHLLRPNSSGPVVAVSNGDTVRYHDPVSQSGGGGFAPRHYLKDSLTKTTTAGVNIYTLKDPSGRSLQFSDFAEPGSKTQIKHAALKTITEPDGTVITVTNQDPDTQQILEMQRVSSVGSTTITESLLYSYVSSGVWKGELASVTLRRKVNSGSWSTVRSVEYTYYDRNESYGRLKDLKTATIKDASGTTVETKYYRYYATGLLHYVFEGPSYARLAADVANPLTATDTAVAPYADFAFAYDTSNRVIGETVAGLGTYTFEYAGSSFSNDYNNWKRLTIETLPNGSTNTVYTNYVGQVLLTDYHSVDSGEHWLTYHQYDSKGREILVAYPSAVSGYSTAYADLLHNVSGNYAFLRDSAGLIQRIEYATSTTATSSTAGDVAGYVKSYKVQHGETATAILVAAQQYYSLSSGTVTIYPIANVTSYRNTNGTGGETTSFAYTWFSGKAQAQSITVTLPTISTTQNGSNSADTETTFFDPWGRPIWHKDGEGYLSYVAYDQATGAVVKTITDVDTSQTTTFANLPSGWTTPSGGGLHLTSTVEVDELGRPTKTTDPDGNISYAVYKEADHEVRVYAGWQTGTNTTTGPTQVIRADWGKGYLELLTMSATPAVTSGGPTGTESIGSVQTLARSYRNEASQVVREDTYFDLTGVTYSTSINLGTEGVNFYRTAYAYDPSGRRNRMLTATGTIYRILYDGLDRPVSSWVGTDDTPTSGTWPTSTTGTDLVKLRENQYDGGGVGDGNLTQVTLYPGGGADARVSQVYFDWRDRAVGAKSGVQVSEGTDVNRPIVWFEYDNLDRVVAVEQYDGDNVTISDSNSDGVPDTPSSSLRRARQTADYDNLGRVYRTQVYSVSAADGSLSSNTLNTNYFYGSRGQLLKVAAPGGLVSKAQYDSAGRLKKTFVSDGGGDSGWGDADDVTGDKVLSQTEYQYDANSNVLLTTVKERFHDETGTGALGDASTTPKARVSYATAYYDAIDRPTAVVNVGTNGGSAYTRPGSVPSRSDTELVTSFTYKPPVGWRPPPIRGPSSARPFTTTWAGPRKPSKPTLMARPVPAMTRQPSLPTTAVTTS